MSGVDIGFSIEGLDGFQMVLGIMADAVSGDDLEMAVRALMHPTVGPGSVGYLVEEEFTLERSVAARFANQGPDGAYTERKWTPLVGEPLYLSHKLRQGGGTKVGTWYGSTFPLAETFKRGDPDHIEYVRRVGTDDVAWAFGSRREYAQAFHAGRGTQPWDGIPQPAREVLPGGRLVVLRLARAVQRMIVGRIQESGGRAGAVLRGIRVEPV